MEKSLILQEQTILAYLFEHPEKLYEISSDDFVSGSGKTVYESIDILRDTKTALTFRNLAIETTKKNPSLDERTLKSYLQLDDPIDFVNAKKNLLETKALYDVKSLYEDEFLSETQKKSGSIEDLQSLHARIGDKLNSIGSSSYEVYTAQTMLDAYVKKVQPRLSGKSGYYDTGCPHLNSVLTEGFAPGKMTILFSSSGSGKSSYAESLVNKQKYKQLPALYISLEMDLVSTVDRELTSKYRIPLKELFPKEDEESSESPLEGLIVEEKHRIAKNKNFRFVEQPGLSIRDIKAIIQQTKREIQSDYLIVTIDLLTMLREFNKSANKAADYEHAMNELHELCKGENVHIFGVVQSRRPNDKVSVTTVDDLEKFRPQIEQIKNGSAIEERARVVLSAFRKKFFGLKYLPDEPEVELMDDILEIQVLKQNLGGVGEKIKYVFEGELSEITPLLED